MMVCRVYRCANYVIHGFLDESVKEALAAELVPIIWWFFTVCPAFYVASVY
jgi:hypothetical protein